MEFTHKIGDNFSNSIKSDGFEIMKVGISTNDCEIIYTVVWFGSGGVGALFQSDIDRFIRFKHLTPISKQQALAMKLKKS